jgi:hypothetical protein
MWRVEPIIFFYTQSISLVILIWFNTPYFFYEFFVSSRPHILRSAAQERGVETPNENRHPADIAWGVVQPTI